MTEFEIKPVGKLELNLKEIWNYKELFYFFTWRDIKIKYKQTALGILWAVLQPLLMMLIFSVFFGRVLKVPSDSIPYPIFVFTGLMLWNIFSNGISNAGNSMVANSNIIKKIYFPRLIIPISSVLSAIFDFLMTFIVYIFLLVYYRYEVNFIRMLLFFPLSLLITSVATFGFGSFLAALNVKYRDFRYIIPFMIQLLLFVTPVIYPVSLVSNHWIKLLLTLNPMAGAINLARATLTTAAVDWSVVVTGSISAIVLLIVGIIVFRKTEAYFADLA